jgi:hypothetical protein
MIENNIETKKVKRKYKHSLWNDLFYGSKKPRTNYQNRYPRDGGLEKISIDWLEEYESPETYLLRELLFSAAKHRDYSFLNRAEPLCEFLGIQYSVFIEACDNIWYKEDFSIS